MIGVPCYGLLSRNFTIKNNATSNAMEVVRFNAKRFWKNNAMMQSSEPTINMGSPKDCLDMIDTIAPIITNGIPTANSVKMNTISVASLV